MAGMHHSAAAITLVGVAAGAGVATFAADKVEPTTQRVSTAPSSAPIALSEDLVESVRSGTKVATVRKGRRNYALGPSSFKAGETIIPIIITRVSYCRFDGLTDEDARLEGGQSAKELQDALKTFYPDLKDDDEVTIVRFSLPATARNTQ
jgi:hypothetical protein